MAEKFPRVKFGAPAAQSGLKERSAFTSNADVYVVKMASFDLNAIKAAYETQTREISTFLGGDKEEAILRSMIAHYELNGSARNVETEGIRLWLDVGEEKEVGGQIEAVDANFALVNVSSIVTAGRETAKKQYSNADTRSASGSKLFLRCYADNTFQFVFSKAANMAQMKDMRKIATKLSLSEKFDIAIASAAFPDIFEVSRTDALRYLRIMSVYGRRQRSSHNKKDVLGHEVDQKGIFVALAERMMRAHPKVGTIDSILIESIWSNPDLLGSDKALGDSKFVSSIDADGVVTLRTIAEAINGK